MCANSPKDYTKAGAKRLAAKEVHNRIEDGTSKRGGQCDVDRVGWYQRIENNGWRLVSDRVSQRHLLGCVLRNSINWKTFTLKQPMCNAVKNGCFRLSPTLLKIPFCPTK